MKSVFISDYTLRVLAEQGGTKLLFREKLAIASALDRLGADAIELPPLSGKSEDAVIIKTIAPEVQSARLCLPCALSEDGVAAAWACIRSAKKPCLQLFVPASAVTMEYRYHKKEAAMLALAETLCAAAAATGAETELVAEDAMRADREFLKELCKAAERQGVARITLSDDDGQALPQELAETVKELTETVKTPICVQVSDLLRLAVASALAALDAGAAGVKTAVSGETALRTTDLAAAITARGNTLGVTTGLQTAQLRRDVTELLKSLRHDLQETATAAAEDIFLDGECSEEQVAAATVQLGYTLSPEDIGKVHAALRKLCERKGALGAKELEALIASSAMQAPSTYHLKDYSIVCNSSMRSVAHIELTTADGELSGAAVGDGPIDAAFRAIEQCIGCRYELDEFQIQAVTEGKEALGSALVRLREGGRLYSGNGLSTDIVGASIRAYLNAMNKTVADR